LLKRIHVNQHIIRNNAKGAAVEPPLTIKTYKNNHKAHTVEVNGSSKIVYSPDKPLSCGAKVWIETDATVTLDNGETV